MEEENSSHVAASAPMDTPEREGADATKPAVDESSGKGDDEEKPKTLLQALGDQSNRNLVNLQRLFDYQKWVFRGCFWGITVKLLPDCLINVFWR